jgi:hypothetical protein
MDNDDDYAYNLLLCLLCHYPAAPSRCVNQLVVSKCYHVFITAASIQGVQNSYKAVE